MEDGALLPAEAPIAPTAPALPSTLLRQRPPTPPCGRAEPADELVSAAGVSKPNSSMTTAEETAPGVAEGPAAKRGGDRGGARGGDRRGDLVRQV